MITRIISPPVRLVLLILAGWGCFGTAQAACTFNVGGVAADCPDVKVNLIGIDPRFEGPMVMLVDVGGSPAWTGPRQFYLSAELGNAGLATLLTAVALDQAVFVRIADPNAAETSLISIIFLSAPTT